jgi:hypothetical protein
VLLLQLIKENAMRNVLLRTGQYLLLVVLFFVFFSSSDALIPVPEQFRTSPEQAAQALPGLLLLCLVDTALVMLVILRARWRGWRLAVGVGFALYGVMTFMSQIETAWFGPALGIPASMLPSLFLMTVPVAVVFVPLAVLILGKWRGPGESSNPAVPLPESIWGWVWRLGVIAVLYVMLYFGFGMLVAWQNPALRAMYGEGANTQVFNFATLIPFQFLRSALWVLFLLPIVRMDRGGLWQTAVIAGLWLALPMNMFHAVPNPFMPDPSVRLSHFIETATSNFLFGMAITWLLAWRPAPKSSKSPATEAY